MGECTGAPIFVFAPFVSSTMRIEPAWIDYNGHLNMAYYLVLFDRATDEALGVAGLGPDYVEERGSSYFTAETHVVYARELCLADPVRATMQLVGHDEKRIHAYFELRHAEDGWLSATCEKMFLHVALGDRKVCPFPDDIRRNLAVMAASHERLPRPDALGRVIGLRPKRPRNRPFAEQSETRH